jgi:hypothetical protein
MNEKEYLKLAIYIHVFIYSVVYLFIFFINR